MSQIKNKFIEAASGSTLSGVTDVNIRLRNNQPLRARNAANSADVNILSVNASDVITMAGTLSMGSNLITNVLDPVSAQDAATKNYVDTEIAAITGFANTTLSNLTSPTALNQDLLPGTSLVQSLGSGTKVFAQLFNQTQFLYDTGGVLRGNIEGNSTTGVVVQASASGSPLTLRTTNNGASSSNVNISSGNAAGGSSGSINLLPGTATTTVGTVNIGNELRLNGSTSGYVGIKSVAAPTSYTVIMPSAQGAASTVLTNDGSGNLSWGTPSSGITTIGPIDSETKSADGLVISGSDLVAQTADESFPGMVSTGAQNFIGNKSFRSDIIMYDTVGTQDRMVLDALVSFPSGNSGPALYQKGNAPLGIFTESAAASQELIIESGNASAGGSGYVTIKTGTATGTRGDIVLDANNVMVNVVGSLDMGAKKIIDLADPTAAQDAATKYYVDQVAQGLKPKQAVRVGTLADIDLSSAPASIDGITLASGDRVLVKDQTLPEDNGIYDFNGAASAMTRSADFDSLTPIDEINGAYTFIQEGTQAGQGWVQQGTVTTIGTDPIVFVHFSSSATVVGGDMITVTGGDTISVDLATVSGLESTNPGNPAGQLRAKVDAATVKINASNELESLKSVQELITLNGTDITNQYVDLANAVYGTSNSFNSVNLSVVGGPVQAKTLDYTVDLTGGSGGVTRIDFINDLATGGVSELVSGDILLVSYSYLG